MQHIIRECIGAIFVILFLLRIRKKRKNKKQVLFSVLALSVVLCLVFFSFENLFLRFRSTESAFTYFSNQGTIACTVESDNSALIISFKNSQEEFLLLGKKDGTYCAPLQQPRLQTSRNETGSYFSFINEPWTNNYYVIVLRPSQQETAVTDSCNSTFSSYTNLTGYFLGYVAYVQNVDETYYVQIDDDTLYMKSGTHTFQT